MQQFAGRLYGPLIAAGIAWWHGSEGNYWGHNAIIRVRAFARGRRPCRNCSGRKPFGGHILSHDFIEAALMRRAGWAIHMAPTLGGSFEECPPSLTGYRRARPAMVSGQPAAPGGSAGARAALGVAASSADRHRIVSDRAALVDLSDVRHPDFVAGAIRPARIFPERLSLFPQWPAQDPVLAAWVFPAPWDC